MSIRIGILLGSIREGRNGAAVANWVLEQANLRNDQDVTYELIDLKSYDLPHLGAKPNESQMAAIGKWSADMASFDGYVVVTPEYNHVVPGTLTNAFQFLKPEVANKAMAFVGYGWMGATRAIAGVKEQMTFQGLAIVSQAIHISFTTDYVNFGKEDAKFAPGAWHNPEVVAIFNQVTSWAKALKLVREGKI
ncbi:NAD(P)H-dependent oxidoreductase [Acholeplasma equirhinis]|uniref:NADPH-dependent FMN reductase n=1 Tax=Acholeplasma equirhinis TaxID=555393 RepID=UPI00197AFD14|nr:NAD(P)H-dependent oxidoreductase [Acholeplasma equirhinis]MBN3490806.1 NAD(P)H-dependent oxidoreductase [Acholeplasma equirhinis]